MSLNQKLARQVGPPRLQAMRSAVMRLKSSLAREKSKLCVKGWVAWAISRLAALPGSQASAPLSSTSPTARLAEISASAARLA